MEITEKDIFDRAYPIEGELEEDASMAELHSSRKATHRTIRLDSQSRQSAFNLPLQ